MGKLKPILGGIINLNIGDIEVDAGSYLQMNDEETLSLLKKLLEKGEKYQLLKPVALSFYLNSGDLDSPIESMTSLCNVMVTNGDIIITSYFFVGQSSYTLEVTYSRNGTYYIVSFNART